MMNFTEILKDKDLLRKFNSITKYPSIYTYHALGEKGTLKEEVLETLDNSTLGYVSEKIDGTNTRIILEVNDYIIGSREELLYSYRDRIVPPTESIVKTIKFIADMFLNHVSTEKNVIVIYGEVYGGNIGKGNKNYTTEKNKTGYRVFDVAIYDKEKMLYMLKNYTLDQISSWREHGGQKFLNTDQLKNFCERYNIEKVPDLDQIDISKLPKDIEGMYNYMSQYRETLAGLNTKGNSEGLVVRSDDRKYIRKIRFEEYEKTLKKNKKFKDSLNKCKNQYKKALDDLSNE